MNLAFTRRTDYAVRAALELALADDQVRTHRELAAATGAPEGVVKQALSDLARAGVALAERGRRGGYRLARPPAEISVFEIVSALEPVGREEPRCVLHNRVCPTSADGSMCPFHETISAARQAFIAELRADSLAAVARRAAIDP